MPPSTAPWSSCATRVGHKPAGFTNAVMRRISEQDLESWMDTLGASQAVRHSHPEWIVEELARALDRPAELDALLVADNARPLVTLVARPGLSTVEELSVRGRSRPVETISPLGLTLECGDPGDIPAVREGRAGVQDAGSQLVALAWPGPTVEGRDERWLDLCAGPGGKAALLAALADQRGARLLANERQPHRSKLVAQAIRATQVTWSPATAPVRPGSTVPSTARWSMLPARDSVRCAVARRAAGGVRRPTWPTWSRCSKRCSGPR